MTSRRMVLGTGGGPLAAGRPALLTAAPSGGWTQTQGPHGIYYNGKTYFTYCNVNSGNLEIRAYDHASHTTSAPFVLHGPLIYDTHDAGSVWVRLSDHRIMAFYSGENGTHFWQRISTNPEDITAWDAEVDLAPTFGGNTYTYPHAGQFADGTLWVGFRDEVIPTDYLCLAKSTDDGATWTAETQLVSTPGVLDYWMVHYGAAASRIDMAVSNGNGVTGTHVSVYHAYWQGGSSLHKTDGTSVSAGLNPTGFSLVHDGSAYPNGWASGMAIDGTGAPVMLIETLDTANGHNYGIVYARWNGSSWVKTTVTTFSDSGLALVAHSCLDEVTGATLWVAKPVSGVFELFRYVTADNGATFVETQITRSSASTGNVYPANVHNRAADLGVLWLVGSYTATDVNNVGTKGAGV
jgi:hypothetical protein